MPELSPILLGRLAIVEQRGLRMFLASAACVVRFIFAWQRHASHCTVPCCIDFVRAIRASVLDGWVHCVRVARRIALPPMDLCWGDMADATPQKKQPASSRSSSSPMMCDARPVQKKPASSSRSSCSHAAATKRKREPSAVAAKSSKFTKMSQAPGAKMLEKLRQKAGKKVVHKTEPKKGVIRLGSDCAGVGSDFVALKFLLGNRVKTQTVFASENDVDKRKVLLAVHEHYDDKPAKLCLFNHCWAALF